jgi:hypothetical protein
MIGIGDETTEMSDDTSEREVALLELRRELLNFIVEEISVRVERGELPAVERRLNEIVRGRADTALANALQEGRLIDAKQIAHEISSFLQLDKSEGGKDINGSPPDSGLSQAGRYRSRQNAPKSWMESGDPAGPPIWLQIWYWLRRRRSLVVAAVLFITTLILLALYLEKGAALNQARAHYINRTQEFREVCRVKRALQSEAVLLKDDQKWRSQCESDIENQKRSRICLTEARLRAFPDEFLKNCP